MSIYITGFDQGEVKRLLRKKVICLERLAYHKRQVKKYEEELKIVKEELKKFEK